MAKFLLGLYNLFVGGSMVAQILLGLGIGTVTYTGLSYSLDWLKTQAIASIVTLPTNIVQLLAVMKVGTCISMVFSAYVVRLTIQGLSSDSVKKWVTK